MSHTLHAFCGMAHTIYCIYMVENHAQVMWCTENNKEHFLPIHTEDDVFPLNQKCMSAVIPSKMTNYHLSYIWTDCVNYTEIYFLLLLQCRLAMHELCNEIWFNYYTVIQINTVNSQLSRIQASRILIHLTIISKKTYHFYEVLQKQICNAHMLTHHIAFL
jgi:hypothetical protein